MSTFSPGSPFWLFNSLTELLFSPIDILGADAKPGPLRPRSTLREARLDAVRVACYGAGRKVLAGLPRRCVASWGPVSRVPALAHDIIRRDVASGSFYLLSLTIVSFNP